MRIDTTTAKMTRCKKINKIPIVLHVLVFLMHISSCKSKNSHSSSKSSSIGGGSDLYYNVPIHMKPDYDTIIKEYKVISSHGRVNDKNTITTNDNSSSSSNDGNNYKLVFRCIFLVINFLPLLLTSFFAYISTTFCDMIWFPLLGTTVASSGAAFIKWAQWSSTRPDMFPEKLCSVLASLQTASPTHSLSYTKHEIQQVFHSPIEEIFQSFDVTPIASGSIAQIYKARLNNKNVAVKVRHPGVKEQIELDFIIMHRIASFLENVCQLKWLRLSDSISQFSTTISSQTDLQLEGKNLVLFNRNFRKWRNIKFPEPYVMTNSILIESFEEGLHVSQYTESDFIVNTSSGDVNKDLIGNGNKISSKNSKNRKSESERKRLVRHFIVCAGENVYLKMLLMDNLMHADLHPGNIIVRSDRNDNPSLVLVDAGMVAQLTNSEKRNFIGLLECIGIGNGVEAAMYIMDFSVNNNYPIELRRRFTDEISSFFTATTKGYGKGVDIGTTLRGILTLVRKYQISIDANYATIIMNALCLDSLAHMLMPTYNIIDGAKPLLQTHRFCKKLLGSFTSTYLTKLTLPISLLFKMKADDSFYKTLQ